MHVHHVIWLLLSLNHTPESVSQSFVLRSSGINVNRCVKLGMVLILFNNKGTMTFVDALIILMWRFLQWIFIWLSNRAYWRLFKFYVWSWGWQLLCIRVDVSQLSFLLHVSKRMSSSIYWELTKLVIFIWWWEESGRLCQKSMVTWCININFIWFIFIIISSIFNSISITKRPLLIFSIIKG